MPWERLLKLIGPHYPKAGKGRQPKGFGVRIYCLQQGYGLSDPGAEEALYDMESMRRFAGLELGEDTIPDETTILDFRHLLEQHNLSNAVFGAVKSYLSEQGLLLASGGIADTTIIHAPPSTKNQAKQRDPERGSTKKGNTWHFGMKAPIRVDAKSGLIHTVGITTASDHDSSVIGELIREGGQAVFGDKGYYSDQTKRAARRERACTGRCSTKPSATGSCRPRSASVTKNMLQSGRKWNMSSHRQMPARLPQDPLQGNRQERGAGVP